MKVLAIITGRPKGVSEFIAKTALKGAVAAGAEVEIINTRDLEIKTCIGCNKCHMDLFQGGPGGCVFKDDIPWVDEQIKACDGLIVVSPCFEKSPPSDIKLLYDRMGPSHDITFRRHAHEKQIAEGKPGQDVHWFKERPCAFIAHGGSDWTNYGLPILSCLAITLGMKIVDLLLFNYNTGMELDEDKTQRILECGRNVAENCGKHLDDMQYIGRAGHCPVCHNTLMDLGEMANDVQCSVCGMRGTLSVEPDGRLKMTYPPEEFIHCHMTETGRSEHEVEIKGNVDIRKGLDQEKYRAVLKEATEWLAFSKPPRG